MGITDEMAGAKPPPSGMPPEINLASRDVEGLKDELRAYHRLFAPLFEREEQRHWALKYLQGQMLDLERKSIEPMALSLLGGNVQAMQQFISKGTWKDDAILQTHQQLVAETLGDAGSGVLIIDGCEFPKQGRESVGVARQYCGALGKIANCQASVLACYASVRGATLVDYRLFLPEQWFTAEYRQRRERTAVPADQEFQTRGKMAGEMIQTLRERGQLAFSWVTFDEHFGNDTALLDKVTELGLYYLAEVKHDTRVWPVRVRTGVPPSKRRNGRQPTRERVLPGEPPVTRVDQLAAQLPADQWQRYQIKEGAKGPLVAEFAFVRAVAVREAMPGPDVWVVFRRSLEGKRELKAYLSNAPVDTPKEAVVRISGMRWPIETVIAEAKSELGMDHYEVRGWRGWHHHMTMTLLAHHFLVRLRLRLGGKSSRAHRTASAPVVGRDVAQAEAGPHHGHPTHPTHPNTQLPGLSFPSTAYLP